MAQGVGNSFVTQGGQFCDAGGGVVTQGVGNNFVTQGVGNSFVTQAEGL